MSKTAELNEKLDAADALNLRFQTFRHYKGGIYTVEDLIIDTDDGSLRVLYYRIGGHDFDAQAEMRIRFARPIGEFLGQTEDGTPRFTRVRRMETWVEDDSQSG